MRVLTFTGHAEIHGRVHGVPFGVKVVPSEGTAQWIDPQPEAPSPQQGQGSPSSGCEGCGDSLLVKLAKGGVGVMKAITGMDSPPSDVMEVRHETCSNCPSGKNHLGVCNGCGCLVALMIRVGSKSCPDEHWSAHAD